VSLLQDFDWSIIQNAGWSTILQVIAFFILIAAIGILLRRVSHLAGEMRRLCGEVKGLTAAEQKRLVQELKVSNTRTDKRKSVA